MHTMKKKGNQSIYRQWKTSCINQLEVLKSVSYITLYVLELDLL